MGDLSINFGRGWLPKESSFVLSTKFDHLKEIQDLMFHLLERSCIRAIYSGEVLTAQNTTFQMSLWWPNFLSTQLIKSKFHLINWIDI